MESIRHESQSSGLDAVDAACPVCGHSTVRVEEIRETPADDETRVVEGTVERQSARISYMPARVATVESRALVPVKSQSPALAALAQLPALAWRQPVVRSAVKTGASAVALSVALRVAGRVLATRAARDMVRESLLPTLADFIAPPQPEARPLRRGRREQVSEVFIYIRRTARG